MAEAARQNWVAMVMSASHASVLSGAAAPEKLRVHLKIDTGMGRLGVHWREAAQAASQIADMPGLSLCGLATHFASAGESRGLDPRVQLERFHTAAGAIREAGLEPGMCHAANSGAFLHVGDCDLDGVRIGLAAYGQTDGPRMKPSPCLNWSTHVIQVRSMPQGSTVGYGSTHETEPGAVLAVCDAGYADGYRREFGNAASVIIRGQRCPVVGRVSMNFITVDVSALAECRAGDPVLLLGEEGEAAITAAELATIAGTIPYEILTGIRACAQESVSG